MIIYMCVHKHINNALLSFIPDYRNYIQYLGSIPQTVMRKLFVDGWANDEKKGSVDRCGYTISINCEQSQ